MNTTEYLVCETYMSQSRLGVPRVHSQLPETDGRHAVPGGEARRWKVAGRSWICAVSRPTVI